MKQHRFTITDIPRLDVRLPVGELRILAGAPGVVEVNLDGREASVSRFIVEQRGSVIHVEPDRSQRIHWSAVDVLITTGSPADLHARLTSGNLVAGTELNSLIVETASGEVVVGNVRVDASIRSASGDVRLADVGGRLDAAAASGDIRGDVVGSVEVKSASGDVQIKEVLRDAVVRTASGDVTVGRFSGDSFDVKSMSGDISVGVPPGRRYDVEFSTLSGEIRTDFPIQGSEDTGSPARLEVKTVSGDIRVKGV